MKALILAGGKGSRLYPFSATLPKPLMPLGEMPILELLLRQLAAAGIDHAILAVNHMRHLIEAFFGDGSRFGLTIEYSLEDKPLGTAGPIGAALDRLGEDFVLANGDLLTTLDVGRMIAAHRKQGADATIGVFEREVKVEFGLIDVDEKMRMVGYREKPSQRQLV
ncbi:MAG: nucleotidyltransferase family protein, partial [Rhodospirillales bacterium]|nr:nucleotidyltransferase family protein [Rhodospirillales bacterium]